MEAAVRSAHYLITGKEMTNLVLQEVRGLTGIKEAEIEIAGIKLKIAVVNGLANARKVMDDIKKGIRNYHFVEVMSCPGGCIAGGGQPHFTDPDRIRARMQALYDIDRKDSLRLSHHNTQIKELYDVFLGVPLGEKSHHLLHTTYRSQMDRN